MTSLPNTPAVAVTHNLIRTTNGLQYGKSVGYYIPRRRNVEEYQIYTRLKEATQFLQEQEVIGIEKKTETGVSRPSTISGGATFSPDLFVMCLQESGYSTLQKGGTFSGCSIRS